MTAGTDTQLLALYRRWWTITERRSTQTVDHYLREIELFQETLEVSLADADRLTIEAFVVDRTEHSSHTGRWAYRGLRSLYKWMLSRELVDTDPTDKINAPREEKNPTPTTVTADDFNQFLTSIEGTHPRDIRDRAIVELLWATGLRRGELLRMELHHVNLDQATIMIPITKTKRPRVVPVTEQAINALALWLEVRLAWHPTTDHVWQARHRGHTIPMTANAARLMIERRRRTAGLDASSHAFRRGATVNLLRSGVSGPSVERILGWSVGSPMMANYSRALGQELALDEYRAKLG
jgi:site-specific recombinase XerD